MIMSEARSVMKTRVRRGRAFMASISARWIACQPSKFSPGSHPMSSIRDAPRCKGSHRCRALSALVQYLCANGENNRINDCDHINATSTRNARLVERFDYTDACAGTHERTCNSAEEDVTRTKSPFVLDAVEEFLRTKEAREPKTYASYSSILLGSERGTKPSLGIPLASYFRNRRFATLTHDEVATWFAQRVRGGAQVTKHRISKSSRAFLRFARERRYTEHDLASAIAAYSAGGPRVDWLGWPEIHQLVGGIPDPRYRFAVAWVFWSGCRVGEACTARQQDVQLRHEVGFYEWSIPHPETSLRGT